MKYSILYKNGNTLTKASMPSFFQNLNMNQIVDTILYSDRDKETRKYYYSPLKSMEDIQYRLDVFLDFENHDLYLEIQKYLSRIQTLYSLYQHHSLEISSKWLARRSILRIMEEYSTTTKRMDDYLENNTFSSEALIQFKAFLHSMVESKEFQKMNSDLVEIQKIFQGLTYTMVIKGSDFYIDTYKDDKDFGGDVNSIFDIFHFEKEKDFTAKPDSIKDSRFTDEAILMGLCQVYKKEFQALECFVNDYQKFFNVDLYQIAMEFRFYSSFMVFKQKLEATGLSFTLPKATEAYDEESIDSYDVALAIKLMKENKSIVTNSYTLVGKERMIILSGPNQGGKTTFSRQLGQLHYMFSLGLPVAGKSARLHPVDQIYAYYKTEENLDNLSGKLESELLGVKEIISKATKDSLLLFNEIYSSTTALDGVVLSKKLMDTVEEIGCFGLFVTFYDELSTYSEITTSYVSNVLPDNPMIRTFKITKRKSDGMAYANAISERHHMTYLDIRRRIR